MFDTLTFNDNQGYAGSGWRKDIIPHKDPTIQIDCQTRHYFLRSHKDRWIAHASLHTHSVPGLLITRMSEDSATIRGLFSYAFTRLPHYTNAFPLSSGQRKDWALFYIPLSMCWWFWLCLLFFVEHGTCSSGGGNYSCFQFQFPFGSTVNMQIDLGHAIHCTRISDSYRSTR